MLTALVLSVPVAPAFADTGSGTAPDPTPSAGPGAGAPDPSPSPIAAAIAQAMSTGQPVTVPSQTTQTHQLTANPDGTLTAVDTPLPVRVDQNGTWVPVNATLAQNGNGTYSPAATPSGITLSGGGTSPLAVLTDPAGHQLSYSLPFTLPAPTVSGSTALYSSVLPGVDLSVSVTDQGGFSNVLIVHSASAAANPDLTKLTLAASTQGLILSTDAEGDLDASAADGSLAYTAPKPVMWDSSTTGSGTSGTQAAQARRVRSATTAVGSDDTPSSAAGPGTGAQVDPVAMSVSADQIALTPDQGLLTGSGTQYPVYIDPSINPVNTQVSGAYDEVYSDSECSGSPQYDKPQTSGEGVGYQNYDDGCGTGKERSFYTLPLSGIPSNASVSSSKVTADDTYAASWSCSQNQPVTLHTTGSITSSTDWNNQPATLDTTYNPVPGNVSGGPNPNSSCSQSDAVFTVTTQMQNIVKGGFTSWTVALFGAESPQDTSNANFLRFSTSISITTNFDVPPDTPTNASTTPDSANPTGAGCNNGAIGWIGASAANGVTLNAKLTTAMNEHLEANFDIWDNSLNNGSNGATTIGTPSSPGWYASGTVVSTPMPTLQDGHEYGWGVQAEDDNPAQHLQSPWISECHFTYDATPPATPSITANDPAFPPLGSGTASTGYAGIKSTLSLTVTAADPFPANTCTMGSCKPSGISHFIWKLDGQPTILDNDGTQSLSSSTGTGAEGTTVPTGTATITVPVINWGVHTISIAAVDNAGNPSQVPISYTFYAPWNTATPIQPGDIDGDAIPDLLATSKTGDLDLISGKTGPSSAPILASPAADSPTQDTWNNYWTAHRGTMVGEAVDDLYAFNHVTHNLYAVKNNLDVTSKATPGFTQGKAIPMPKSGLPCDSDTPANRCSSAGYDATDWNNVTQIAAPGDVYAAQDTSDQYSDLITVENGELWLYRGLFGPALSTPVLLGDGDWSNFTLISPGTLSGAPTLWARDNASGNLYSFNITPTGAPAIPPLLHAPNSTVTPLVSGIAASGGGQLCLADPSGSTTNGTDMITWGCENGPAQSFALAADNTVHIMGKCLDVAGSGTANNTPIELDTCNGTGAQTWTHGPNGSLVNPESGKCLADPGSSSTPNTDVLLWPCDSGSEQNWNSGKTDPLPTAPTTTPFINLPTSTYPVIASPGDANAPTSTTDPTGAPDGNPDLYVIDNSGQLLEYPGGPTSAGAPTFTTPVSLGTVTNTATHAWTLADGNGTTAHDSLDTTGTSNPGIDAALTGGATWNTDPALTTADRNITTGGNLALDGTTGYATTPTPTPTSPPVINTTGSYSVSAWVKLNDATSYHTALCQRDATGARCAFYLQYSPALDGWAFVSPGTDSASTSGYYSAGLHQHVTVGTWTHLVGTFDATTGNMSLYVNGHLAGTGNNPQPWQAGGPFLIGAADNGSNGNQAQFPGQIADVHVYNTALPPADATDLGDSTPMTDLN